MTDDLPVTYECPRGGTHDVPGENVRIMKCGDGGFIVACGCGPGSLAEADSSPHPDVDHLVNIYADDPSPEQWLGLENHAEGWYDAEPHVPAEDYDGTRAQRRAQFRDDVEQLAGNDPDNRTSRETWTREVECPQCGASAGTKCQRPSGHSVKEAHSARIDAARKAGHGPSDMDDDEPASQQTQVSLEGYA